VDEAVNLGKEKNYNNEQQQATTMQSNLQTSNAEKVEI
jgi:hypothetical protein